MMVFCKQTSDIKKPDNSSLTMFFNKFTKVQKIADFWENLEILSVSILNFEHHEIGSRKRFFTIKQNLMAGQQNDNFKQCCTTPKSLN